MPGSSSTSFIPKHTPNKPERRSSPRQVFFGTLLVRILFVAVLIAALGVFLYLRKLDNELKVEVDNFTNVASSYEADRDKLAAILAMDERLLTANTLLNQSVSINSLFTAIERSVIGTVQLKSLALSRDDSGTLKLSAEVETDSFDSTIFQRSVFEESEVLGMVEIDNVTVANMSDGGASTEDRPITFSATIEIDPAVIPAVVVKDELFVPISDNTVVTEGVQMEEGQEATDTTDSEATESLDPNVDIGFGN